MCLASAVDGKCNSHCGGGDPGRKYWPYGMVIGSSKTRAGNVQCVPGAKGGHYLGKVDDVRQDKVEKKYCEEHLKTKHASHLETRQQDMCTLKQDRVGKVNIPADMIFKRGL